MYTVWTNPGIAGLLPAIFLQSDPRPAAEQLNDRYAHGGGFMPTPDGAAWTYLSGEPAALTWRDLDDQDYVEDFAEVSRAQLPLTGETLILFDAAMLVIAKQDGSYQLTRVD